MITLRRIALAAIVALFATLAHAQTINPKLQWDHADSLTNVQGYTFYLKADASAAAIVPGTCAQNGAIVTCTTPLVISLNAPHTIILAACTSTCASATLNYVPPPSPIPPTNIKTVITITWP